MRGTHVVLRNWWSENQLNEQILLSTFFFCFVIIAFWLHFCIDSGGGARSTKHSVSISYFNRLHQGFFLSWRASSPAPWLIWWTSTASTSPRSIQPLRRQTMATYIRSIFTFFFLLYSLSLSLFFSLHVCLYFLSFFLSFTDSPPSIPPPRYSSLRLLPDYFHWFHSAISTGLGYSVTAPSWRPHVAG